MTFEVKLREEREEARAEFQAELEAQKKRADEAEKKVAELMKEFEELKNDKK